MDINIIIEALKKEYIKEPTIERIAKFYKHETIETFDYVLVNGDSRIQEASIFIVTPNHYIRLKITSEGYFFRSQHIIQSDIAGIIIGEKSVFINLVGYDKSHEIKVDDYETALKLQMHLMNLRG